MAKTKEEINEFCRTYEYIISEPMSVCGFINYHQFDKGLIETHEKDICKFLVENFNIDFDFIYFQELLEDENGKEWMNITSLEDIELLDRLSSLAFAVGALKDNLELRFAQVRNPKMFYLLTPERIDFDDEDILDNYISSFKSCLLQNCYFQVNTEYLDNFKKSDEKTYDESEVRDLLLYWWDYWNLTDNYLKAKEFFINEMEKNLDDVLIIVTLMHLMKRTSLFLAMIINENSYYSYLNTFKNVYKECDDADKIDFEDNKYMLLKNLNILKNSKKKRLL